MLFVVVERFKEGDAGPIRKRFRTDGRMMPDGVTYRASWVGLSGGSCFQLMEADRQELLAQWTRHWEGLLDFEIVAVVRVLGRYLKCVARHRQLCRRENLSPRRQLSCLFRVRSCCESVLGDYLRFFFAFLFSSTTA
jgi:hypothetical protein